MKRIDVRYRYIDQLERSATLLRSPLITSSVGSRFDLPALARDLGVCFLLFDGVLVTYSSSELLKSEYRRLREGRVGVEGDVMAGSAA